MLESIIYCPFFLGYKQRLNVLYLFLRGRGIVTSEHACILYCALTSGAIQAALCVHTTCGFTLCTLYVLFLHSYRSILNENGAIDR